MGTLVVACGALAREITSLVTAHGWEQLRVTCLPAKLHNHPDQIPDALRNKIQEERRDDEDVLVMYGDCGTSGGIDKVLAEFEATRIPGAHCYAFYAGEAKFDALMAEEPGSFFLTDYLVRQFETLIIKGLGLDRFPQLHADYFGNYHRLVYLAQTDDDNLDQQAQAAAKRLGLIYEKRRTGLGDLADFMVRAA
ncbi:MAG: DUF1638 domain-containing protein [Alphaproteobacteria bacterium]|jgi:hypothetical protein|nr:DUF1638 domain-containing protein [Alphaproteobacteria bacterium]MBT4016853.1 DUF1638 domain-containing protein [Alphaproteobacteria bacterium]MBT5161045.1 DUF1638 domain-containing protein [Alphaproteobacteria bacterium]MBT5919035.1 DUF1638 domain-containing protein [Alphaproteobacteria bacterium]MBT6387096.1 DUF1638 domain-containing protein [Alphaproteobacteria bacterium]